MHMARGALGTHNVCPALPLLENQFGQPLHDPHGFKAHRDHAAEQVKGVAGISPTGQMWSEVDAAVNLGGVWSAA